MNNVTFSRFPQRQSNGLGRVCCLECAGIIYAQDTKLELEVTEEEDLSMEFTHNLIVRADGTKFRACGAKSVFVK